MRNIVIAPDSFKGTLSADEICSIVSNVVYEYVPDANIKSIPMSDGGEGMIDCFLNLFGGYKIHVQVTGPQGESVKSEYGVLTDNTAVTEIATCAGLHLMKDNLNPLHATTYGMGELLIKIADSGAEKVLIGVGGSATNDLGVGMAAALGYRFLDCNLQELEPFAYNLGKIEHIEKPEKTINLNVIVACDVDSPLCGSKGATYTFGKQKGVTEEMVVELDNDINHFADVIEREFNIQIKQVPGAGAAGGLGAALLAFLGAKLQSGIDILLDTIGFDELLKSTDLVLTGEGRIDWQSLSGKVPIGISRRAKKLGIPCIALCGSVGAKAEIAYEEGMSAIFSSIKDFSDNEGGKEGYTENIRFLTDSVMRLLMLNERVDRDV